MTLWSQRVPGFDYKSYRTIMGQVKIFNSRHAKISVSVTKRNKDSGNDNFFDVIPGEEMIWDRMYTQTAYVYKYDSQATLVLTVDPYLQGYYTVTSTD
ncbi:hypothetical protein JVT61DRAFT_11959 [Boletus reticuloceps]|uniref:Uncharacterized protein n=1 Tax=Boletus reticuloceps TaxID=495285 RepID=A0A8I3A4T9_9AGAM|nr:hypothetical protein JVT61DRAFT_11959 [Boletus reticuloceps]